VFATILIGSTATTAFGQTIDPNLWVTNGSVYAVARSGGTLYIGGDFTHVGPASGGGVAVPTSGGMPTNFPKIAGRVYAVAADGSGGWYVGGLFNAVGGIPRSNLVHLDSGLSVTSWNPSADGSVRAITVSGSKVYVGGNFQNVGGQARARLAALNTTTGAATAWNANVNGEVLALAVSGSRVYVGGNFTTVGGISRSCAAAVDSNGVVTLWNPNPDDGVTSIVIVGSSVYVGGSFLHIQAQPREHVAKVLTLGSGVLTGWDPGADSDVQALVWGGSSLYVGGYFTSIGNANRSYLAEVDTLLGDATSWDPEPNSVVLSVALGSGVVYAGGYFTFVGSDSRHHAAAIDRLTGIPLPWNPDANHNVWALAWDGFSKVFVGGQFTSIGGQGVSRASIAALDLATGVATAWNPSCDGYVNTIAVSGPTVYVGGGFSTIGLQPRSCIAALDTVSGAATTWNPGANSDVTTLVVSGSRIYAGGYFSMIGFMPRNRIAKLSASFNAATTWDAHIADGYVATIAVDGSTVYFGGTFTTIAGQFRMRLAAVDTLAGGLRPWNPGASGPVYALAVSGPVVYAGGNFSFIGGQSRYCVAALDKSPSGSASAWSPSVTSQVRAIALSDSTVYAGGDLYVNGVQTHNGAIAIDARTGKTSAWDPDATAPVYAVLASGSQVYLGGDFTSATKQATCGVTAMPAGPDARDVQPGSGGDGGVMTITVVGYNLIGGATVKLARAGQPDLTASLVDVAGDARSIAATFDLTGAVPGAWDVVVTNPDGQIDSLTSGFTVNAIAAPQLRVSGIGPPLIRANRATSYDLVIENPGNVDAIGVPLWIYGVPTGASIALDFPLSSPPRSGGEPDWSTVPLTFTSPGGSYLPLVLPRVSPGTTVRRVRLTLPPTVTTFKLRAALTPPWVDGAVFRSCLANAGISNPTCMGAQLTAINDLLATTPDVEALSGIGVWAKIAWQCEGSTTMPAALVKAEQALDYMEAPFESGAAILACSDVLPPRWRDSLLVTIVSSYDPNDKLGAQGNLPLLQAIPYSIRFENASTATAPAQQVVVSDPLNTAVVDPATVSLDAITFGSIRIVPPPGLRSYATQVDLRPAKNLLVNVSAAVDLFTGVLSWYFSSIDPATGRPPTNPLAGFLPANVNPPEGEGSVLFTVMPRTTLTNGTQISNGASITFDENAPHTTPNWINTVDNTPPSSAVLPLPGNSDLPSVPVNWTSQGAPADLRDFTVYVKEDAGAYRVWRQNTTANADTLVPPKDHKLHTYAFYSVARDVNGNIEAPPSGPDATTQARTAVGDAATWRLALAGARPNPTTAAMRVWFTLENREPASLEVIDIAGRRVARRDVGSLGPGPHSVLLAESARLEPGLYFLRLVQGERVLNDRVAVIY
jgi:hypothetical protein